MANNKKTRVPARSDIHLNDIQVSIWVYLCPYLYLCIYVQYMCICVCMYLCVYVYVYVCARVCVAHFWLRLIKFLGTTKCLACRFVSPIRIAYSTGGERLSVLYSARGGTHAKAHADETATTRGQKC